MTSNPTPLPMKSSTYVHRNCISSMKMAMKNVKTKVPIYDFIICR